MRGTGLVKARMIGVGAALVGAAVSGQMAWLHMRSISALGAICGESTPHCGWCPTALILAAVGVAGLFNEWRSACDDTSQGQGAAATAIPARRPS